MIGGRYSFRFNGFANAGGEPYYLIGVGILEMRRGKLTGHQRSSVVRIEDPAEDRSEKPQPGPKIQTAGFTLDGDYQLCADGIWEAAIKFRSTAPQQVLHSKFALVEAGKGETLWLISTETILVPSEGEPVPVPEMVTGEAIRIG